MSARSPPIERVRNMPWRAVNDERFFLLRLLVMHFNSPRRTFLHIAHLRFSTQPGWLANRSKSSSLDTCRLVLQNCQCKPVVVTSRHVADLGLRLLQLSLA